MQKLSKDPNKLLSAFSLYTNGKKLFDLTPSSTLFNSLNGIRSISALWIVFLHRNSFILKNKSLNNAQLNLVHVGYNVVDTFFVIGGLLQTISLLKALNGKRLNIPRVICKRYLRYTPAVIGSSFIQIILPQLFTSSEILARIIQNREIYSKKFWTFPLHIQNYTRPITLNW